MNVVVSELRGSSPATATRRSEITEIDVDIGIRT
jgi:hypothetical protein